MNETPVSDQTLNSESRRTVLSGQWTVAAMFVFAITATSVLYFYWKMHIGPFVPLQKALAAEFKDSRPRVEGGQRKMHRGTPRILRITMKVDYDPNARTDRAVEFAKSVSRIAERYQDLSGYQLLELHFFWPEPEQKLHEWAIEIPVEKLIDWRAGTWQPEPGR